jgi:uncharacterized protein YjbI with pentapeptide repeats
MARAVRALRRCGAKSDGRPGLPPLAANADDLEPQKNAVEDTADPAGTSGRAPLVAKANELDDLEALKKAVEDAASVGGGLWFSYIFVLFYIAVAAGAVTHVDLFLESPVKLPFLGIELPLKAFFCLAPFLFLITHTYVLAHLVLLSTKIRSFHKQLEEQISDEAKREGLRGRMPSNIFVQFIAGQKYIRESWFGVLLKSIAWATLAIFPVLLFLLLQIQFLPYHSWITWIHRVTLFVDLMVVWWLWRWILTGSSNFPPWRKWKLKAAPAIGAAASFAAVLFSYPVATFPGEWLENLLPSWRLFEPRDVHDLSRRASFNELIFYPRIDPVTLHRESWFSNRIVLLGFNLYEGLKIDDPKKVEWRDYLFDARGRDLQGAVFDDASLPKVDFTGALLQGASLYQTLLQGASFRQAWLRGASLDYARLQGASLNDALLQGASFRQARLEGASLDHARLQGASLDYARLQGASLREAQLQGASLDHAQLQGASLDGAQLQGASLDSAQLQGASLREAQLQGAALDGAQLQGASFDSAQLQGASLSRADMTATSLTKAFIWRTVFPEDVPGSLFAADLSWRPEARKEDGSVYSWTISSYDALRLEMQKVVPEGERKTYALNRVEILDCQKKGPEFASCGPNAKEPASVAELRQKIEKTSVGAPTYKKALAVSLGVLVCDGNRNAIYVLRGLLKNHRIITAGTEASALVERILNQDCPVPGLTEDDKAKLRAFQRLAAPAEKK